MKSGNEKVAHGIDFELASSQAIAAELGRRLNELRLAQDLTQAQLAERAGVSRGTVVRLEDGGGVSLDSFIRMMQALGLQGHLAALLPDPTIRPVEEVRQGRRRQRASGRGAEPGAGEWRWGDETEDEEGAS